MNARLARAALAAVLLLSPVAAKAVEAAPHVVLASPGEAAAPPPGDTGGPSEQGGPSMLEGFNAAMHGFNLWVWGKVDSAAGWTDLLAPPQSVQRGLSNFLSNLINEPTAAISWVVAGDYGNAGTAAQRFWINTTQGWLGTEDVARGRGLVTPSIDIGLALCSRGVSEGAYVVLPVVGPRTVRDGLADFLLVNTMTYIALAPVIGFPPSLQSVATVEVVEEAGRVAIMRQIDHGDDRNPSADMVRDEYLKSRRARCDQVIAAMKAKPGGAE